MDSLYTRYANALLSIAIDENNVSFYRNEIKELRIAFLENPDIIHLLSSKFILFEEKEQVIDSFYNNNDNINHFLKIIVRNNRSDSFIKIFNEFVKSCNEVLNIKDGIVYSVRPLKADEIKRIEEAIKKKLSTDVELDNVIDEKLIGGVKVIVEDKIFDASIKNKIEKLKDSLVRGESSDYQIK